MPHFLNSEQNYEKRYKTKKANDNIEIIDIMAFCFAQNFLGNVSAIPSPTGAAGLPVCGFGSGPG
jgi:hypothetical protein